MSQTTRTEPPPQAPSGTPSGRTGRKPGRGPRPGLGNRGARWVPYAFLVPALVFELVVHFVPMLAGLLMSFLELTQYQLSRW